MDYNFRNTNAVRKLNPYEKNPAIWAIEYGFFQVYSTAISSDKRIELGTRWTQKLLRGVTYYRKSCVSSPRYRSTHNVVPCLTLSLRELRVLEVCYCLFTDGDLYAQHFQRHISMCLISYYGPTLKVIQHSRII